MISTHQRQLLGSSATDQLFDGSPDELNGGATKQLFGHITKQLIGGCRQTADQQLVGASETGWSTGQEEVGRRHGLGGRGRVGVGPCGGARVEHPQGKLEVVAYAW